MLVEEELDWMTVNGVHIPIKKGQTKQDAYDNFATSRAPKDSKQAEQLFMTLSVKKQTQILKNAGFDDKKIPNMTGKGIDQIGGKKAMAWSPATKRKVWNSMKDMADKK